MSENEVKIRNRAREMTRGQEATDVTTLSTGVRVRLKPVSSTLVEELKSAIEMPEVPKFYIEAQDRYEENPNDPRYIDAVERVSSQRAAAVYDALILFGVELVDGMPQDDKWVKKLKMLERLGRLDLSKFDLKDEFDREFLYLRHVAVAGADLRLIVTLHGLNPAEVARARNTFLGDQGGNGPGGVPTEALNPDEHTDESGAG